MKGSVKCPKCLDAERLRAAPPSYRIAVERVSFLKIIDDDLDIAVCPWCKTYFQISYKVDQVLELPKQKEDDE